MARIISFFNNKGGVGKTTSCYSVAWSLSANHGKRVLLVDFDPQCNLTGFFCGIDESDDQEELNFEKLDQQYGSVYKMVADIFNVGEEDGRIVANPRNKNLYLLPGDVRLSSLEPDISLAISTKIAPLANLPGSFYHKLTKNYGESFDYILIDMSPNLGILNLCALMSSSYFIMPVFPDYFCLQVTRTLPDVLRRWAEMADPFRKSKMSDNPFFFPSDAPQFMGMLVQNFRIRKDRPSRGFADWEHKINENIKNNFVGILLPRGMSFTSEQFSSVFERSEPFVIMKVSDYNTLSTISQKMRVPVVALTEEDLTKCGHVGKVLSQELSSVERHKTAFDIVSKGLLKLL